MKETEKDSEQDRRIDENTVRIKENAEAIRRQTEALEQIRDHYYPPPAGWWKKASAFFAKVVCVIVAYLGVAETVDWLWNVRESDSLAAKYAKVAERLFYGEGDAAGAISCYEKAVELDSKESEYRMLLTFMKGVAMVAEFMGNDRLPTDAEQARIDSALAEAFVLKELEPKNPLPYVLMAQALLLSGEKTNAVEAIERAVACEPKRAPSHVSACAIHFAVGHLDVAREHLAEAERLDASMPLLPLWKGVFALNGDHDAATACRYFEETIRRLPRYAPGYRMLARSLFACKDPDLKRVREAFRQSLILDAKLLDSMLGMAETYEREGNLVLARLWLDRALVVNPRHLPALVARARVCSEDGDMKTAIKDLTQALALAPYRADLYRLRGDFREKAGETAQAKSDRRIAAAIEKAK